MSKQTAAHLKDHFKTKEKPDGQDFQDLIDTLLEIPLYDVDPRTTGPGGVTAAYSDIEVNVLALIANVGEWAFATDTGMWYYWEADFWRIMGTRNYTAVVPYIAGSNGERNIRIRIPGKNEVEYDEPSWILLPIANSSDPIEAAQAQLFDRDDRIFIDTSFCNRVNILSNSWSDTNVWDRPILGGNGFKLRHRKHAIFEYYPSTSASDKPWEYGQWTPVDGVALLLMGSSFESDGWGNNAEVATDGYLRRYTNTEAQQAWIEASYATGLNSFAISPVSEILTENGIPVRTLDWHDITDLSNWNLADTMTSTYGVRESAQFDNGYGLANPSVYTFALPATPELLALAPTWYKVRFTFNRAPYNSADIWGMANGPGISNYGAEVVQTGFRQLTPGGFWFQTNNNPTRTSFRLIKVEVLY